MALAFLVAGLVTGCVFVPVPVNEDPYFGAVPGLEVGKTTREDVVYLFDLPAERYADDTEFVYAKMAESWKVAWALVGPGGDGGVETLSKRHVLLLSFDEEGVLSGARAESAGDDFGDCTASGICFAGAMGVMRYADEAAGSREFEPVEGYCSIYLHGPGAKQAYEVRINKGRVIHVASKNAFIHILTEPGKQQIVVSPEPAFLNFDCRSGQAVFAHYEYRWVGRSKLYLEDQEKGRGHISARRRIRLPTGAVGPYEQVSRFQFQ